MYLCRGCRIGVQSWTCLYWMEMEILGVNTAEPICRLWVRAYSAKKMIQNNLACPNLPAFFPLA
jgi:hypothetical protein